MYRELKRMPQLRVGMVKPCRLADAAAPAETPHDHTLSPFPLLYCRRQAVPALSFLIPTLTTFGLSLPMRV